MADLATFEKAAKEAADKAKACQTDLSVKKQEASAPKKLAAQKQMALMTAETKLKTACMAHSKAANAKAAALASKTATPTEKEEKTTAFDAAFANMKAKEEACSLLRDELTAANNDKEEKEAAAKEAKAKWMAAKHASDKAAKAFSDQKAADAAAKKAASSKK